MINNNSNRRQALRLLLAGSVAAVATGCGVLESLPSGQTGSTTDGEPLSMDVREALLKNALTAQLKVDISTAGDEIIIKGFVPNQNDIDNVEQVANKVPGVRHVLMDLYVQ